jgi:hypothetical protein
MSNAVIKALTKEYALAEKKLKAIKLALEAFGHGVMMGKKQVSAATRRKMQTAAKKRWATKKALAKKAG